MDNIGKLKNYLSIKYDMEVKDITRVKNVMHIFTNRGDLCLKRVKYRKEHFLFILSAMMHLADNGFDGIIPLIPSRWGEPYIELEDGYGFLTKWISCRECDYSNPIELKKAAAALGRIHNTSQNFTPPEGCEPRIGWGKWVEKFSARIDELMLFKSIIKGKAELSHFDSLYLENVDFYINQAFSAVEHLKNTKYFELMQEEMKRRSFCHHDYAHHNVLISDDFKVFVIDFDYCICDSRLHDLSSLIIRNMRHGNWNMEKAQYIIDCYLKEGWLHKDEIPVMNAFMEFPQDFWQVGLQYYVEKQDWDEAHFNKRLNNAVNDKIDRQQFLDEFKYSICV